MRKNFLILVAAVVSGVGLAQPAVAGSDPASDYARSVCLSNGWKNLGFQTYLTCYNYYYSIYGTPDQPEDPYNPGG